MSAATVASTSVEPATAACVSAVVSITAMVAPTDEAVRVAAPVAVIAASIVATVAVIATVSIVAATAVVTVAVVTAATVEAVAIAPVEPRTGADEDAAAEVVRPVVAVGSAGVRIVAVVTIGAGRCWPDGAVHGTYSNTHGNLRVGVSRGK